MRVRTAGYNPDGEWEEHEIQILQFFRIFLADEGDWPNITIDVQGTDLELTHQSSVGPNAIAVIPQASNVIKLRFVRSWEES